MKIAFDIGNVLISVDMDRMINYISTSVLNCDYKTARSDLEDNNHHIDLDLVTIGSRYGKDAQDIWMEIIKPCDETLGVLEGCISREYEVAYLSNIGSEHASLLKKIMPDFFHKGIKHYSYRVGARKPQKLFYQSFLFDNPSWIPEDLILSQKEDGSYIASPVIKPLFFDDKLINVNAASKYFRSNEFDIDKFNSYKEAAYWLFDKIYHW